MNKKQFLLTKEKYGFPDSEEGIKIGDYTLYKGSDLEYCCIKQGTLDLYLLGSVYDWENPERTNKQILGDLAGYQSLEDIIKASDNFSGEFIVIINLSDKLYIFNDASAQREIYYDIHYRTFGSQPGIIGEVTELVDYKIGDAKSFYQSDTFENNRLFIGTSTHKQNIKHLLPNHYICITENKVVRFFPSQVLVEMPLDEVAYKVSQMLIGITRSICLRKKAALAVTGGFDSRLLFLSSLDTDSIYFIYKNPGIDDNHPDIIIPGKLTSIYGKDFHVISKKIRKKKDFPVSYSKSIDFPRYYQIFDNSLDAQIFINGGISEIARNNYGNNKKLNARDICYLLGNKNHPFVIDQYKEWLKSRKLFEDYNYHFLDMLYWEERDGIWGAKAKTEAEALGYSITTPFNSRKMINLMLSTKRKYRDYHFSHLHRRITHFLSEGNTEVRETPFFSGNNPGKTKMIVIMKRIYIYRLYRYIAIKTRKLRI